MRGKKNPNIFKMRHFKEQREHEVGMTNSEVVGYPQEHTSLSHLQKTAHVFHSPLHTCLVSSPTRWEWECLALFLWTIQRLEMKSVFPTFFSQRKERRSETQITMRIEESLRGQMNFPGTHQFSFTLCFLVVSTLWHPTDCSRPGLPVLHNLPVCPSSCPLSQWSCLTISSSATPFSFCLQSFPASGSFRALAKLASKWAGKNKEIFMLLDL